LQPEQPEQLEQPLQPEQPEQPEQLEQLEPPELPEPPVPPRGNCASSGCRTRPGLLQLAPGRREQDLWRAPAIVNCDTVAGKALPERQVLFMRDYSRELRRGRCALAHRLLRAT